MGNSVMNMMKENGFITFGSSENYHMNWKTLENFMPEKAEILKTLWRFRKEWPIGSSIPVYDISSGKIYPSAALDRMGHYGYDVAIRYNVLHSIDTGLPVKGRTCRYKGFDNVWGHVFMAIEDVPTKIIKEPPLPMPFSVISSEIHITSTEPAVNTATELIKNNPGLIPGTMAPGRWCKYNINTTD